MFNLNRELNREKNFLIKEAKRYLNNNTDALNSLNYLYTNGGSAGYFKLKMLESSKKNKHFFSEYLKEVAANFFKDSNLKIIKKINLKSSYQKLYFTWGKKENFNNKGIFFDKYFGKTSENKKNLWIINYSDSKAPEKITGNIIILKTQNNKFSLINFLKNILIVLKNSKFSITKFFHYLPFSSVFAFSINKFLIPIIKNVNFKEIFMPYESQPFQQFFIKNIKEKISKKIKVTGYIHSFLPAMPTYYIYRKFSPDRILVHGSHQKKILTKFLGWKKKKIAIVKSLRFKRRDNFKKNYFFVGYNIFKNSNKNIENFEKFLIKTKNNEFKNCVVKLHPEKKNNKKHVKFKLKIDKIISKYQKKFSKKKFSKKINFCFGESSVIIESLERGVEVIHFSTDPILEVFIGDLWKNIVVKELSKNIYHYRLKKKGTYLNL